MCPHPHVRVPAVAVEGLLPLSSVDYGKSASAGKPHELRFQVEGDSFFVCEVSESAAARLGAKLLGYLSGDGGKLTTITTKSFQGSEVGLESLKERFGLGESHTLVFDAPVKYKTTLAYLDAKEWGVPQTRQRKYMLIWDPAHFPAGVDVEKLWHELVHFLRCPLKYDIDSFLLADENDRIHRFRDALRGPLGRLTAMSRQGGDWWHENANRDTEHTKAFRAAATKEAKGGNMLNTPAEEMARPITGWGPQQQLSLASDRWWVELAGTFSQRQLDLCDCFGLKAAEVGLDALHHSLWWNISQNVGRTDPIPLPGITGCITPGGETFGPHRGRCVLGYEKLLLSGIPADKLLLGTESEVQLSDLAGNAMVMPVVSAAILAALCVPAYARKAAANAQFKLKDLLPAERANAAAGAPGKSKGAPSGSKQAGAAAKRADAKDKASAGSKPPPPPSSAGSGELIEQLLGLRRLCEPAESNSILCTCESSGGVSDSGIVQCRECLLTMCRSCGASRDLRTHENGAPSKHACCVGAAARLQTASPAMFEQTLRREAPIAIVLEAASAAQLSEMGAELPQGAAGEYRLTRVMRERGSWRLSYSICDPEAGNPLAEVTVTIGRMGTGRGVSALLFSFAAASRGDRGKMAPIARLLLPAAGGPASEPPRWEVRRSPRQCTLELASLSSVPSYRSELGLTHFKSEEWPSELRLAGEDSVAGVYERAPCRFSAVFGALWRRRGNGKPLWLLVNPTVDRTAPDVLVVCSSPTYRDCVSHTVLEMAPEVERAKGKSARGTSAMRTAANGEHERPFDLLCRLGGESSSAAQPPPKKAKKSAQGAKARGGATPITLKARLSVWEPLALRFSVPPDPTTVKPHQFGCFLSGLPKATTQRLIDLTVGKLGVIAGSRADADGWHELRVLTVSSTVAERRLAEAVAAPLLAFAARGGLSSIAPLQVLERAKGQPAWGACAVCAPPRPVEIWTADGKRTYDVEESSAFEKALRSRPSAWDVRIRVSCARPEPARLSWPTPEPRHGAA